ncbi:hypothetical protein K7W42_05290 [Deinococcus sp. HMF7604]|uniref:hypothetical protein n=1 Tax=Deinococcus betulae TaxID=2873312 RepID=UPI001CCBAD7D|nr:hypothetical protein [Deinococcus betulae]MBZ9750275.1 hypothetical protein [Deinococcus betulae]
MSGTFVIGGQTYPVQGRWDAVKGSLLFSVQRAAGKANVVLTLKNGQLVGTSVLGGQSDPMKLQRVSAVVSARPTPYVMTGVVKNSAGQPLAGVKVFADNTLYHNMNALATTDAQGRYRLELPREVGTWRAGAYVQRPYGGGIWESRLYADNAAAFSGDQGAIRNFTWRLTGVSEERPLGGTVWIHPDWAGVDYDTNDVELTLTPVGPLLDGSVGQAVTWRLGDDYTREDIPVGTYTLTARQISSTGQKRPMLVKSTYDSNKGHYAPSVTATFQNSAKYGILMELDIVLK